MHMSRFMGTNLQTRKQRRRKYNSSTFIRTEDLVEMLKKPYVFILFNLKMVDKNSYLSEKTGEMKMFVE